MRSIAAPASLCVRYPSSLMSDTNIWTRSADETILWPKLLISSMVPASTKATYGTLFFGEYCMAIFLFVPSIFLRLSCSSSQDR